MPAPHLRPLSLRPALIAAALALAAAIQPGAGAAEPSGPAAVVTIGDKPFACRVVRHDDKGVTVFLTEAKSTVTLQWDQLAAPERERIRALVAAKDPAADNKALGEEIDGVEVTLVNGTVYRGVELAGRSTPELRAFRFARMPYAALPAKDIRAVKAVKLREGELYSPQERYRKKLAVAPPQSAEDHFQTGCWCLENGLAEAAGDHFDKAVLLDPGYAEKTAAKKGDLDALRTGALPPKVERPSDPAALRRAVIAGWHQHLDHHLQRTAFSQVSETPAVPVKVVRLTNGTVMEGALKGSEEADEVQLDIGGRTYAIERKLIARMDQKMVEAGPFRDRTLAECRKYATDPKGGIGKDVAAGVAKDLGIDEKEVLEVWAARLGGKVVVGARGPEETAEVASLHEAHWGVGSWLRGGGAGAAGNQGGAAAVPANPRGNRGGRQSQGQQANQQQLKSPEDWWKEQAPATKAGILRAMCAEESGLFKIEKVFEENCPNCAGTGQVEIMAVGTGGGGKTAQTCPVCRGGGKFFGVSYR
ncbi:MAG TPA: hypothetical protein PK280_21285 [Planctomycetota bacterium]|nr:hypothetical protein [Planctomycetota bacterium]